jgi:hypothetical protein
MVEKIKAIIANHPCVSFTGICSMIDAEPTVVREELKALKKAGVLKVSGGYYRLEPMFRQLNLEL